MPEQQLPAAGPTPAPPQRHFEDVTDGQELSPVRFPLSVYRLVVAAGANRDFNSIHHNSEVARASGAPDMYASTTFLLGMWERSLRQFIGAAGRIRAITGFRMRSFNVAGQTVVVHGRVTGRRRQGGTGLVDIEMWSDNGQGVSVGPGTATISLPCREGAT
jgi:acyl dehydratase